MANEASDGAFEASVVVEKPQKAAKNANFDDFDGKWAARQEAERRDAENVEERRAEIGLRASDGGFLPKAATPKGAHASRVLVRASRPNQWLNHSVLETGFRRDAENGNRDGCAPPFQNRRSRREETLTKTPDLK
jgi:hypothetical protein